MLNLGREFCRWSRPILARSGVARLSTAVAPKIEEEEGNTKASEWKTKLGDLRSDWKSVFALLV